MPALAFRSSPRVCLLLPGAVSCAAPANSLAFRSGAHEVFLGPYNYPFMHLSPARMKTPISYSSVDRCVLSPYCGLGKTQHPFLLGAFVLAGEIDTGTGSRVATSLTCVRPAPGSVRHTVDPGAVTLTRGAVNEGKGRGSGSHPRTNTYGGRSERSPGPESQGRRVRQSAFCWEFCVLRVPWVLPHLPMLLNAQPATLGLGAHVAHAPVCALSATTRSGLLPALLFLSPMVLNMRYFVPLPTPGHVAATAGGGKGCSWHLMGRGQGCC